MDEIKVLLDASVNPYNNVCRDHGKVTTTNSQSFYRKNDDTENLTFDVGNQKVLANISTLGSVKSLCFYRDNHLTEEKPGVWVNKVLAQTENLDFSVNVGGKLLNLNADDHTIIVDTLEDSIPRVQHLYSAFDIIEIPFCPIENNTRKSLLAVSFYIHNKSNDSFNVLPVAPKLFQEKYSDQQNVLVKSVDREFKVRPGSVGRFSYVFVDPDCYRDLDWLTPVNANDRLTETVVYFQNLFGGLGAGCSEIATSFKRTTYESMLSLAMDKDGNIVGANWGSSPVTERIWNKDMFYIAMPVMALDANLARKIILWFSKYSVKPHGTKFPGGISHSLGNSLAAGILAGIYYKWTGDAQFFIENPMVLSTAYGILTDLETEDGKGHSFLKHSEWVSDAYALGDVHTGSNICLWAACDGLSQIFHKLGDKRKANHLNEYGQKVHQEIDSFLTIEDSAGLHWLEGRNLDGNYLSISTKKYESSIRDQGLVFLRYMVKNHRLSLVMHDGEESDTTMAPVYGFVNRDDPRYRNTMSFAGTEENPTYVPELKGISWGEESGATFPGFITLLMGHGSEANDFEQHYQYLNKLADLDGSWWWWPYPQKANYGSVVRNFGPGKCGWASGMAAIILLTQYFGINAVDGTLVINPMQGLRNYCWENAHLGGRFLTVDVTPLTIAVKNLGKEEVSVLVNTTDKKILSGQTVVFER